MGKQDRIMNLNGTIEIIVNIADTIQSIFDF